VDDPAKKKTGSLIDKSLLRPFLGQPGSSGIFVDFDGTLSPIVEDPDAARPEAGVADLLARLADRFARVAVVSGRPVAYLADNLAGAGAGAGSGSGSGGSGLGATELIGLYGFERIAPDSRDVQVAPEAEEWRGAVDAVASEAERRMSVSLSELAGLGIERKGLTVTLHYRKAPGLVGWVESFAAQQAASTGLVAHPGKMSIELRPPVSTDKGTVVARLARGLSAVCYLGDDIGDLPAFEVLSDLRRHGVHTLSVAVRSASGSADETPPAVLAAADVVVEGPEGALSLLWELAGG